MVCRVIHIECRSSQVVACACDECIYIKDKPPVPGQDSKRPPLLAGAKVVLMSRLDIQKWFTWLHTWRVSHLVTVPVVLEQLARADRTTALRHLRYVVSSGDLLRQETAKSLQQRLHPDAILLSLYGACETTADAMVARFSTGANRDFFEREMLTAVHFAAWSASCRQRHFTPGHMQANAS
jgi:acyl-CoA synthetase (AMP-forming)/AMP-acid ligase II